MRTAFPPFHALAWLLLAGAAQAKREDFHLDPVHTRVAFQVSHAGFSRPVATFSKVEGELQFDEADWRTAHVEVRIPVATLELGNADWQKKILDRTFFDAATFPQARFVSTTVEPTDATHARVTGDLTLHGITRPATLNVTFHGAGPNPFKKKVLTVGFDGEGVVKRSDYGMGKYAPLVSDETKIVFSAAWELAK